MKTSKLTVVIPCLNEEPILEEMGAILLEKVKKMEETGSTLRDSSLLFIDDHSSDRTWEIITLLSQKDSRIHGISLGKQSGQQTALYAGLMWARENSDICISMDCDGQDDPEAMELLAPLMHIDFLEKKENEDTTDAAAEAITAEMQAAMMKYMPLRGSFSFASGSVTPKQLQEVLDKLNG